MRLPTQDLKPVEERKRRRRTVVNYGGNISNGDLKVDEFDEITIMRQEKVAKFAHHKRVADYLLGRSVGEGSFAKVRLGLHVQTAEEVAVKVISKARARKDAYVDKNLRREGRILQMTRHRNIIQVYDILETDNNYYLVTEFCKGGELIDIVTEKGFLPESDVRRYISQLTSAVSHLHDHGIVHRDLKVENLLLDERGDLKVIDFGLSNVISGNCSDPTRALATQCGSPAYAAPELLAKNNYGPKVDVWSIGVITYALLVGKLPFTVEPFRIPKLCRKMMMGDMNPIPGHLSSNCRHFIKRLLIPDPEVRPSISQVLKMPWIAFFGKIGKSSTLGKSHGEEIYSTIDIDAEIVREMTSKLDYEFSNVLSCVRKNRPGEALATYYLLMKQRNLHKKESIDRSRNDVIGSDGNLENESDKSSEEEGTNDIGGFTQKDLIKNLDLFKEVPKMSNTSVDNRVADTQPDNKAVVNDLIEKYTAQDPQIDTETSLLNHEKNSPNPPAEDIVMEAKESETPQTSPEKSSEDTKSKSDIENTSDQLEGKQETFDCESENSKNPVTEFESPVSDGDSSSKEEYPKTRKSVSKIVEVTSRSGKSSKCSRKSRGPAAMRDILKSMSRAKDVLQRRNFFGHSKSGRYDDRKNTGSPELSKFRKLTSRNGQDSGVSLEAKNSLPTKSCDLSKHEKSRLNSVPNGTYTTRIKLSEATPPTSPMETKKHSLPSKSPAQSRALRMRGQKSTRAASLFYGKQTTQAPKTPTLGTRTSYDGSKSPDIGTSRLPRISTDKNDTVTANHGGYDSTRQRFQFPSPPRTPSSRDTLTTNGNSSGVREIIEKFHALMGNGNDPTKRTPYRSSAVSKKKDPSNFISLREKREDNSPKLPIKKTTSAGGTQVLRLSSNGGCSAYQRQATMTKQQHYQIKNNDEAIFASHFGNGNKDSKAFDNADKSARAAKYRSRGIWYKSAV